MGPGFPAIEFPVEHGPAAALPVLVGVSDSSQWIAARTIPPRQAHDILGGHLACLSDLGGMPRSGVSDNEAALVSRTTVGPDPRPLFNTSEGR